MNAIHSKDRSKQLVALDPPALLQKVPSKVAQPSHRPLSFELFDKGVQFLIGDSRVLLSSNLVRPQVVLDGVTMNVESPSSLGDFDIPSRTEHLPEDWL